MVVMRYKISKSIANKLLRLLEDITIYEAKQLLDGLAYEYMLDSIIVIDWGASQPTKCYTTFASHYAVVWSQYDFAKRVRVKFSGGPPNSYEQFTGTLVTFVCDRILYHAALFGTQTVTHLLEPYGFKETKENGCTIIREVSSTE